MPKSEELREKLEKICADIYIAGFNRDRKADKNQYINQILALFPTFFDGRTYDIEEEVNADGILYITKLKISGEEWVRKSKQERPKLDLEILNDLDSEEGVCR
jgi:hypothetical protein